MQIRRQEYGEVMDQLMALESTAMQRWRQGDPWGFIEISAPGVTYFDTGTISEVEKFLNDPIEWSSAHGGASSFPPAS